MSDDVDDSEEWVLPPQRRSGTFLVYDFAGAHDRLPEILELIAVWLRRLRRVPARAARRDHRRRRLVDRIGHRARAVARRSHRTAECPRNGFEFERGSVQ
jgi:hypothetical protein